jgi:hypothetical protein
VLSEVIVNCHRYLSDVSMDELRAVIAAKHAAAALVKRTNA